MKKGFTLIEFLVVIAIISILFSLFLPVFSNAARKHRQTQVKEWVPPFAEGDSVYIETLNLTGRVNAVGVSYYEKSGRADVLVNGNPPHVLSGINFKLLKRLPEPLEISR